MAYPEKKRIMEPLNVVAEKSFERLENLGHSSFLLSHSILFESSGVTSHISSDTSTRIAPPVERSSRSLSER